MSNKPENTEVEERQPAKIEVVENEIFPGNMKMAYLSSIEMADIVSSLFAPSFSDYYGCKVCPPDNRNVVAANEQPGQVYVDLYFKDMGTPSGGWKNINPIAADVPAKEKDDEDGVKRPNLSGRYKAYSNVNRASGRVYNVTRETYEALEEFMPRGNKTNWNEHTFETMNGMSIYGKEEVVLCITGLNLNKIIGKIYGTKTNSGIFEYEVAPSTIIPHKNGAFIMQIAQLDVATVRKLQNELGIYNSGSNDFQVYRR